MDQLSDPLLGPNEAEEAEELPSSLTQNLMSAVRGMAFEHPSVGIWMNQVSGKGYWQKFSVRRRAFLLCLSIAFALQLASLFGQQLGLIDAGCNAIGGEADLSQFVQNTDPIERELFASPRQSCQEVAIDVAGGHTGRATTPPFCYDYANYMCAMERQAYGVASECRDTPGGCATPETVQQKCDLAVNGSLYPEYFARYGRGYVICQDQIACEVPAEVDCSNMTASTNCADGVDCSKCMCTGGNGATVPSWYYPYSSGGYESNHPYHPSTSEVPGQPIVPIYEHVCIHQTEMAKKLKQSQFAKCNSKRASKATAFQIASIVLNALIAKLLMLIMTKLLPATSQWEIYASKSTLKNKTKTTKRRFFLRLFSGYFFLFGLFVQILVVVSIILSSSVLCSDCSATRQLSAPSDLGVAYLGCDSLGECRPTVANSYDPFCADAGNDDYVPDDDYPVPWPTPAPTPAPAQICKAKMQPDLSYLYTFSVTNGCIISKAGWTARWNGEFSGGQMTCSAKCSGSDSCMCGPECGMWTGSVVARDCRRFGLDTSQTTSASVQNWKNNAESLINTHGGMPHPLAKAAPELQSKTGCLPNSMLPGIIESFFITVFSQHLLALLTGTAAAYVLQQLKAAEYERKNLKQTPDHILQAPCQLHSQFVRLHACLPSKLKGILGICIPENSPGLELATK
jgi:hypothetical protein